MALEAEEFSPDFLAGFVRDYKPTGRKAIMERDEFSVEDGQPEPGKTHEKIFLKPALQQTLEGFGTYVSMKNTEYEFGKNC